MTAHKFVAYFRVSTVRQGRSGLGLAAQRAAVNDLIAANGNKLVAEFQEIESGKNRDRPKLAAALDRCRVTGATLVVAKMDRLSREANFIGALIDGDIDIWFCDFPTIPTGPVGRLILGVMAQIAEFERGIISERTKAAMAAAKARGQTFGNPCGAAPLVKHRKRGIRNSVKVRSERADAFARRIAPIIADIRATGFDTAKGIARELNARDIEAPRGGQWGATQVRRALARLN